MMVDHPPTPSYGSRRDGSMLYAASPLGWKEGPPKEEMAHYNKELVL